MKWEKCDINVLEQFIGTPLKPFESFFVNMLVDMVAG